MAFHIQRVCGRVATKEQLIIWVFTELAAAAVLGRTSLGASRLGS